MGKNVKYETFHEFMNVVTFFGLPILSLGVQNGANSLKHRDTKGVKKIYFAENGTINGVQLIGDVKYGGVFLSFIEKGVVFKNKGELLKNGFHYSSVLPTYL